MGEKKDDAEYVDDPSKLSDVDSDTEIVYVQINQMRGRGRPRLKRKGEDAPPVIPKNKKIKKVFVDNQGNPLTIREDEVVMPEDEKGNTKITEQGDLLGSRQFKVRIFKVVHRGDKKYMVSTDIARAVGYRDSYFLFQKHDHLYRVIISEDDKLEMIHNGTLPASFKTRAVYLVAARSIYKEFGAKVIVNGRQVIDDYYEDKAREEGAVEGAPALPMVIEPSGHGSHEKKSPGLVQPLNRVEDLNISWIYDNAAQCRQFESTILYERQELLNKGSERDIYTGAVFVPSCTQPTRSKVRHYVGPGQVVVDTTIEDTVRIKTGLGEVPPEIYEGTVDADVLKAIEEQRRLEQAH